MTDFIRRRPLLSAFIGVIILVVLLGSFPIVPETKQAVVVRFGKPERILNRFEPGRPIGTAGAGLSYRIPFVDQIVWIDKRVLAGGHGAAACPFDRSAQVDGRRIRALQDHGPAPHVHSLDERGELRSQLQTILRSEVRNELGKQPFSALLSPERQGVMDDVRTSLNVQAAKFGVDVIDVRIKKTDLPDGAPLQSAFESMRTARLQEARSIRAQGAKQAQIIRAQADADASKTYAASFGKDPQFYDFYRAMQSYLTTFVGDGQDKPAPTNIILSPQNDYLKEFTGHTK